MAWVAKESELQGLEDGKPAKLFSTESIVLRRTGQGWKIVHIHWSSRAR